MPTLVGTWGGGSFIEIRIGRPAPRGAGLQTGPTLYPDVVAGDGGAAFRELLDRLFELLDGVGAPYVPDNGERLTPFQVLERRIRGLAGRRAEAALSTVIEAVRGVLEGLRPDDDAYMADVLWQDLADLAVDLAIRLDSDATRIADTQFATRKIAAERDEVLERELAAVALLEEALDLAETMASDTRKPGRARSAEPVRDRIQTWLAERRLISAASAPQAEPTPPASTGVSRGILVGPAAPPRLMLRAGASPSPASGEYYEVTHVDGRTIRFDRIGDAERFFEGAAWALASSRVLLAVRSA